MAPLVIQAARRLSDIRGWREAASAFGRSLSSRTARLVSCCSNMISRAIGKRPHRRTIKPSMRCSGGHHTANTGSQPPRKWSTYEPLYFTELAARVAFMRFL